MRIRKAARVLITDPDGHVLLFRFAISSGPNAGIVYWSLPGGAVEEGESFAEAARRELFEETGIAVADLNDEIASPRYTLPLTNGENVDSDERLFLLRLPVRPELSPAGLTASEIKTITETRWWKPDALRRCAETVYPPGLSGICDLNGIQKEK